MSSVDESTTPREHPDPTTEPKRLSGIAGSDDSHDDSVHGGEKVDPSTDFLDFLDLESTTPPLEELDGQPRNTGSHFPPSDSRDSDQTDGVPVANVADIPAPAGASPVKNSTRADGTPMDADPVTSGTAPRRGKSPSEESDTKPRRSTNPSRSQTNWSAVIEVESDPEDANWDDEEEESLTGSSETSDKESSESSDESSNSDSQISSTLQAQLPKPAGKGKGPAEPLSYHALSLRYAALEDHRKEYTRQAQKEISRWEDKIEKLKKKSCQKSIALRKLKRRQKNKDRKIAEIHQRVQSELQDIKSQVEAAGNTDLAAQIREATARIAQQEDDINALQNENVIHALIKLDLETHIEKLQAKKRALESNPNDLLRPS
ncbi:hypothetical protein PtA15_11A636 [Puccinia triticina]|uniref:BZIP domain-containing protein n=1 Tax=Puccinia triticina TaxID=208348 RepID=A0ABY7CXB0_9BASI|nr:uncharacterized protein PtA15_11A636 [Puccinia triticina]WAQ89944.1 hypothetical protein PtA15_11A636 [Puccinia triticina]